MKSLASVTRFRSYVSAHLGTGDTVYLTPAKAREMAEALLRCADDIEKTPDFCQSAFVPVDVVKE